MNNATMRANLACPRCAAELNAEIAGAFGLHRCGSCGGVWLDPETFRGLCEADAKDREDEPADAAPGGPDSSHRDDKVRYLRCPVCDDSMNRVNFARVSGVMLDVCRPHGAWLDAGELRAIRRFVRGSGLARFVRRRKIDAERERGPSQIRLGAGPGIDLIDVLARIPDPWGVPSTRTPGRGFLWAAVLAVIGGAALWSGFHARSPSGAAGGIVVGCIALIAAYRALDHALARQHAPRDR